jgi:2-keto-4-pentenoate hydratase/2-oxohepta-3-ene-1,7-dioic acid hydratase in catechol pathway
MKVVVFGPERRVGVVVGERVVDACSARARWLRERGSEPHPREMARAQVPSDLAGFIATGPEGLRRAGEAVELALDGRPGLDGEPLVHDLAAVRLHAPLPAGARVACAGGNFADHAAAMAASRSGQAGADVATYAEEMRQRGIWGFWKVGGTAVGPGGEILHPARTRRLDYEGEVAIVLGRRGKDIAAADWRSYVWGVTLLGDWSIRDSGEQAGPLTFAMSKNFDTSLSLGPCIVVDELDPAAAEVETLVNGEVRQRYNTRDMVFSFGDYLAHLSRDFTLGPGDIVSGGTAAGTAQDSSPRGPDGQVAGDRFLKPGDTVEIRSPGIGALSARVVAG